MLAATETLVVTYTGANEYSGAARPPAVPLGELLDALDATADARGSVRRGPVRHPLQPFDARNVTPGALVPGPPSRFDRTALAGARAAAGAAHRPRRRSWPGRWPRPADGATSRSTTWRRSSSTRCATSCARGSTSPCPGGGAVTDGLPVEVDNLAQWAVGDRVLHDLLAGVDPDRARQQEWRRGVLPPGGSAGARSPASWTGRCRWPRRPARCAPSRPGAVDVDVDLGGGRRLRGTVPGVYGDRLVPVSYSRLGPTHRLQSWLRLLALSAGDPDRNWTAHTLGRPSNSRSREATRSRCSARSTTTPPATCCAPSSTCATAGRCEPLPLPLKASFTYARQRRTRATTAEALRKAGWDWKDGRFPGEQSEAAHARVWGPGAALPGLDRAPAQGEESDGETTRFGALALRLWSPLLRAEQGSW